ncbi:unnamed protein product [Toxocara canis]|uniref:DNA methylase n=1 Tax=Toxocara canis TaxID=6265 RepID=A0A183VDS5_TOXCA|nr:unnamed protein product [Toxocara canis]
MAAMVCYALVCRRYSSTSVVPPNGEHLSNRFCSISIPDLFSAFYLSSQFAQFSMLTNYFYDPASSAKLKAFLTSVNHLAIVCDPPFRVIVEPLFRTINEIKRAFEKLHFKEGCQANLLLVLPVFVAKHVKQCQSGMEIVDYKVCYTNHSKYTKAEKSVVRIFTDFPLSSFVLPSESGYRTDRRITIVTFAIGVLRIPIGIVEHAKDAIWLAGVYCTQIHYRMRKL